MSKGGRGAKRGGQPRRPQPAARGAKGAGRTPSKGTGKPAQRKAPAPARTVDAPPPMPQTFRLGAIPGATPGKWISIWRERYPATELELVQLEAATARDALLAGDVDAALVRLPVDRTDLSVISLYDEVPVVVASVESALTAADELGIDDLAGEVLIVPQDDVLAMGEVPGTLAPRFDRVATTEDAIATVAAGVGIVVVPMSLARLHHRKDVEHRPLVDGQSSTVALAWLADSTTPAVDAFVGVVRGRTANSSR